MDERFQEEHPTASCPTDRATSNLADNSGITGFRIAGVAISPYAPRHSVSHLTATHESILKLIETLGDDVQPAMPERVFSKPDAATRALGELWKRLAQ